jgi:hypothetical protein
MAGLSINSSPIDSLLHSPPDKHFTLVFWVFVSPNVFRICSICQETIHVWFFPFKIKVPKTFYWPWISFPCRKLCFLISNGPRQSCTHRRSSFSKDDLAVLRKPTAFGKFWTFVLLHLRQLGLLFHFSYCTVRMSFNHAL